MDVDPGWDAGVWVQMLQRDEKPKKQWNHTCPGPFSRVRPVGETASPAKGQECAGEDARAGHEDESIIQVPGPGAGVPYHSHSILRNAHGSVSV